MPEDPGPPRPDTGREPHLLARALRWIGPVGPGSLARVCAFLWRELPEHWDTDEPEEHELAWALGDHFVQRGAGDLAEVCRAAGTHAILAAWHRDPDRGARDSVAAMRAGGVPWVDEDEPGALRRRRSARWMGSFGPVPDPFWRAAREVVAAGDQVPARASLSLAPVVALLEALESPVSLTSAGRLPPVLVSRLDDRFRWSDDFPVLRRRGDAPIPPLAQLVEHLRAQGLLTRLDDTLVESERGRRSRAAGTSALWRAVVAPDPRWQAAFAQDALGVLGAAVLGRQAFVHRVVVEDMTGVLRHRWGVPGHADDALTRSAAAVAVEWYQLGVPLGWWDTGHGPASRRLSPVGRAATASVLRTVATRPRTRSRPSGEPTAG